MVIKYDLQFFGGRGGASGFVKSKVAQVREVEGIKGSVFSTYSETTKESKNSIWIENTNRPHAIIKTEKGEMHIQGDKKDKYFLLDKVNTAVVHLSGVEKGDPKREITKLNKQLKNIRDLGFDIPRITVGHDETIAYVKRKLFTREY